jgi:hypothetical protein
MSKPWFRVKSHGVGYSPGSWQGWVAVAVFLVLAVTNARVTHTLFADQRQGSLVGAGIMIALMIGMIALVFLRSDNAPMRWRWGGTPRP